MAIARRRSEHASADLRSLARGDVFGSFACSGKNATDMPYDAAREERTSQPWLDAQIG